MKLLIGLKEKGDLLGRRCTLELVMNGRQLSEIGFRRALHGIERATSFEQSDQRKNIVNILAGNFRHIAAPARLQFHQTFRRQHLERFAQGRAGNTILLGQFLFIHPVARGQFVRKNLLPQTFGNLLVEGGGSDSSHCRCCVFIRRPTAT